MQNKILLLLFAMIFYYDVDAQISFNDQLEDAKFNIVKKTIEFLSTDTATFKNVKSNNCGSCRSFEDLTRFASDNNLTNAGKNVIEPLSIIQIDTSKKWNQSLKQFGQLAHDKITGTGKERRKQLKSYNEYVASINKIIKDVIPDDDVTASVEDSPKTVNAETKSSATDTTAKSDRTSTEKNTSTLLYSNWIPYGLAATLMGLAIYLAVKNNELKVRTRTLEKNITTLMEKGNVHSGKIKALNNQKEQLEKELKDVKQMNITMERKARVSESNKRQFPAEQKKEAPLINEPVEQTNPVVQKPKTAASIIKFAKYADLVDGFSNEELIDKPDDETIFEISLKSVNTGEYKIIENATAQKYALMNVQYFLGKTCKYETFPMEKTTIQTDSPGIIKLTNGKWTITTPAKISFV